MVFEFPDSWYQSGISSGCENAAGLHRKRRNPVIPWHFENLAPVQTDPEELFAIPTTSRAFFLIPIPCNFENPVPVETDPVECTRSRSRPVHFFYLPVPCK